MLLAVSGPIFFLGDGGSLSGPMFFWGGIFTQEGSLSRGRSQPP